MKQNATLKYSDIEDGQTISDDSESDNATNQAATPPVAINKDSKVTQNTSNCAVTEKQGSQGSSE